MKTRRRILITIFAIVLLYVVIVEVDNYFYGNLHPTSIHQSVENPNECWYQEDDGSMTPCKMGSDEFDMGVVMFWVIFGHYIILGIVVIIGILLYMVLREKRDIENEN